MKWLSLKLFIGYDNFIAFPFLNFTEFKKPRASLLPPPSAKSAGGGGIPAPSSRVQSSAKLRQNNKRKSLKFW